MGLRDKLKKASKIEQVAAQAKVDAIEQVLPEIKRELLRRYYAAGLHKISGDLMKASIDDIYVKQTKRGVRLMLGRGFDKKVYIRGSKFKKTKKPFFSLAGVLATFKAQFQAAYARRLRELMNGLH